MLQMVFTDSVLILETLFFPSSPVLTDNNSLTYVLTSAKLDAYGHRWIAAVAIYNFSIMYRPGSSNADAEGQVV
jgi:hypothetical protein